MAEFNRSNFLSHINRYNLSGVVESVVWDITQTDVNIGFVSPDNTVIGNLHIEDMPFDTSNEIGITQTSRLKKLIRILEDEFTVGFEYNDDGEPTIINMGDQQKTVQFRLSDTDAPPATPTLKHLPDFNVTVPLTPSFTSDFRSAEKALDEDEFSIHSTKPGNVEIVVGYTTGTSVRHNNKVNIPLDIEGVEPFDHATFKSDVFSEILKANEDAENGTWEVSEKGLSRIEFEGDQWSVTYYFISQQKLS